MKKKALLAILLIMTLMLSSCALLIKDEEADRKTVILQLGDETVTKAKIQKQVKDELDYMSYYYGLYGYSYDVTDEHNIADAQEYVVNALKQDMVVRARMKELGLDQLTDEQKAEAAETAQKNYDSALETAKSAFADLEGEELEKAAADRMAENGNTLDKYVEAAEDSIRDNNVRDYIIKDVAVSDEEVTEDYNSKVEADKESYAENAGSWATAANNGTKTLYYTPAGIRRVKQILIKFKDEDSTAVKEAGDKVSAANSKIAAAEEILNNPDATDEEKAAASADQTAAMDELNAALEEEKAAKAAAYANIDEEADAVLAELAGGADWDTLMAEKTQDPGMQAGAATAETGYAIAAGMTNFDSAFVEAGMALAAPGDVTGKVASDLYGYYIIKYVGDETEGAAELTDEMKESLRSSLLTTKQNNTYSETITQWVDESGIKVNLDALKN